MADKEVTLDTDLRARLSVAAYDQWIQIEPFGSRPPARYKHAAVFFQEKLYVIGGSRNGRYLSDIQVFDFRTLKWSSLDLTAGPNNKLPDNGSTEKHFPACAGHSMVKWENKIFVVAGHSKEASDTVTVWLVDLETQSCSVVKTDGNVPTARGGQSVSLVGSKLMIFGGEDSKRQLLNDLHILDLNTMTWDLVQTKNMPPAPRFDHSAVVHSDQYLLIFGGSSHSTCFNDLHVLDLQSMEWSQPETQGASVIPRGGHAGATVDDLWYIVGGGDNKSGATETIVLNMSKLVWSVATNVRERDPLASEGLTLCSATTDGEKFLVAFGGYNGKYNNEVFILKPKPRNSVRPRLFQSPAAAAAAASVTAAYALTTATDKKVDLINPEDAHFKVAQVKTVPKVVATDTDKLHSELKDLESKLVEVRDGNSRLKGNIHEMNDSHTLLEMELQSVQGQLTAERSRCSKLEVQIADIQKRLESLHAIEHELEVLRREKSQIEQDIPVTQRQRSGGWLF